MIYFRIRVPSWSGAPSGQLPRAANTIKAPEPRNGRNFSDTAMGSLRIISQRPCGGGEGVSPYDLVWVGAGPLEGAPLRSDSV